ncbi:MAG: hypothetical protein ACXVAI_02450 [Candidatus Limnocylindrales bacterium]
MSDGSRLVLLGAAGLALVVAVGVTLGQLFPPTPAARPATPSIGARSASSPGLPATGPRGTATGTAQPEPGSVLGDGIVALPQTFVLDVDEGRLGADGDLWFDAVTDADLYLVPVAGAALRLAGAGPTGYAGCTAMFAAPDMMGLVGRLDRLPVDTIALSALTSASRLCVMTAAGHVAELWFADTPDLATSPTTLIFYFETWEGPAG